MIEKLCGEANVDAKDVIIAYLTKQVQELESQLYEASIQIQELTEQDIWCPSNCEKLKELRKQYCERTDCSGRIGNSKKVEKLQQENKQLKDNWKYIKKMLKEARQEKFNINGYCGTCTDVDIDFLLDKMQELQGSDNK